MMRRDMQVVFGVATIVVGLALGACGGKGKGETVEDPGDDVGDDPGEDTGGDDTMIPGERMDELQRMLDRKGTAATRCLGDAVEAGEVKKNSRGKITFNFVIAASGKAKDIEIAKSTIDSKVFTDCAVGVVEAIDFGSLPKDLVYSYTFVVEVVN